METDKLEALLKAATPGPWWVCEYDAGDRDYYDHNGPCPSIQAPDAEDCAIVHWDGFKQKYWSAANGNQRQITANAALIAAAPDLAAEVLRLRSEVALLRDQLAAVTADLAEREGDLPLALEERNRLRAENAQLIAANQTLVTREAEARAVVKRFADFFDKAMEGFTPGYATRNADKTVFGWNEAALMMADFQAARAFLAGEPAPQTAQG